MCETQKVVIIALFYICMSETKNVSCYTHVTVKTYLVFQSGPEAALETCLAGEREFQTTFDNIVCFFVILFIQFFGNTGLRRTAWPLAAPFEATPGWAAAAGPIAMFISVITYSGPSDIIVHSRCMSRQNVSKLGYGNPWTGISESGLLYIWNTPSRARIVKPNDGGKSHCQGSPTLAGGCTGWSITQNKQSFNFCKPDLIEIL